MQFLFVYFCFQYEQFILLWQQIIAQYVTAMVTFLQIKKKKLKIFLRDTDQNF